MKHQFVEETELTDWARKELEKARNTPREENVSMNEIKEEFLQDEL